MRETNMKINFIKVSKLIWSIQPIYIIITIIVILISSLYPTISLLVMQTILNSLQSSNIRITELLVYVGIYISLDLSQTVLIACIGYYTEKYKAVIDLHVKSEILKKASHLTLKDYENTETYNIIQRAQNESDNKVTAYFNLVVSCFGVIVNVISFLILLFTFKGWLILFVIVIPIVKFYIQKEINMKQYKILVSRTGEERKTWYYSYLMTNGNYTKEMCLYKLYGLFLNRFQCNKEKFIKQDMKILRESTKKITVLSVIEQILDGCVFGYIVYNGILGNILIGDVVTYTKVIIQTKSKIQAELSSFAELEKQSLYLDQLFLLLDKEILNYESGIKVQSIDNIKVVDLKYRYKTQDKYVLNKINLELEKGKCYAILGKNGSGKTTLVKILMGFYDDYEGEIFINGINLRLINKENYRDKIGALFQDYGKYEATIRENIAYGNLKSLNDDAIIHTIAEKFNLQSFILQQKAGIDTQLGYWFDDGINISEGQWQKIALSRAFIKDADMYILDEPNAALDAISEYYLAQLYKQVLKDKLGIIIAHRFSNFIHETDKIIIVENGQIIETGKHSELFNKDGVYKRLYELQ